MCSYILINKCCVYSVVFLLLVFLFYVGEIPYTQKFSRYVYFAVKPLIRIFAFKISRITKNEATVQHKTLAGENFGRFGGFQ